MNESFGKEEKLKSKILIGRVFAEGKSFTKYPLKLVYLPLEDPEIKLHKTGVSVPKRKFKKAVVRIHLKRLMRESFRKNKYLVNSKGETFALMFVYIAKQQEDYHKIFAATEELLLRIKNSELRIKNSEL